MKPLRRVLSCFIATLGIGTSLAFGQTNPNLETGLKAYGSYEGGNIDSVSLTNGNLILHAPVFSYPQRGPLDWTYLLTYNNKGFVVHEICNPRTGDCTRSWYFQGSGVELIENRVSCPQTPRTGSYDILSEFLLS